MTLLESMLLTLFRKKPRRNTKTFIELEYGDELYTIRMGYETPIVERFMVTSKNVSKPSIYNKTRLGKWKRELTLYLMPKTTRQPIFEVVEEQHFYENICTLEDDITVCTTSFNKVKKIMAQTYKTRMKDIKEAYKELGMNSPILRMRKRQLKRGFIQQMYKITQVPHFQRDTLGL